MDNLVDLPQQIEKRRKEKELEKKAKEKRKLDISASYSAIENCLKFLEMNKLPELVQLKDSMKKAQKTLARLSIE